MFAVDQVVGVAHGRWAGAAAGDAAEVAERQDPALGGGDLVVEGLQADDLPEAVGQDPADPGVAQDRFDPGSGLRSGPGGAGAGLPGFGEGAVELGGDDVGEGRGGLVGGPAGRDDVGQLRA